MGPSESTDTNGSELVKAALPAKITAMFEQDLEAKALSKKQISELIELIRAPDQIVEGTME